MSTTSTERGRQLGASFRRPGDRRPSIPHAIGRFLGSSALLVYGLFSVYPLLLMVSGAFKDKVEVLRSASLIPERPTLETLALTWQRLDFLTFFGNSVWVATVSIVLILIIFPMAAYAFGVLRFPLRDVLFVGFLAALLVPGITVLLPVVILNQRLGLLGTHWSIIFPVVNGAGPFAILLFRAYFRAIPSELREAAIVDGAREWTIFWRVYCPLARPAFITIAVLSFVAVWNDYVLPSVSLNDRALFTLPLGLQNLLSTNVVEWNTVMAGALFLVVPTIVIFVLLQRYFVAGLQGAVKG